MTSRILDTQLGLIGITKTKHTEAVQWATTKNFENCRICRILQFSVRRIFSEEERFLSEETSSLFQQPPNSMFRSNLLIFDLRIH